MLLKNKIVKIRYKVYFAKPFMEMDNCQWWLYVQPLTPTT